MPYCGIPFGWFKAFAFDGMDVQHLGPFHVLDALHGLDEPNDVVSVLWTEISDVQALEHVSLVG